MEGMETEVLCSIVKCVELIKDEVFPCLSLT